MITNPLKAHWLSLSEKEASSGLKVIAFAYNDDVRDKMLEVNEMTFLGLSSLIDPPREEVPEAIQLCRQAGIKVVMITGDHPETARYVARQIGILNEGDLSMSGKELSVMNDDELVIDHVLNYPNPFTTNTQFWFEHNKPGQDLLVQIHIFSLAGRLVKSIEKTINTSGNRSCEVDWDGRDDFGDKIGRGVYVYRIKVFSNGSKPRTVTEKLVIF